MPLSPATLQLLQVYDNLICLVFLIDFAMNLKRASSPRAYLIGERGWLDLLGSIPSFGFLRFTALFRLARISRLARIWKLTRNKNKHELIDDVLRNRGEYAVFITLILTLLVMVVCSTLVLQAESRSPDANIITGGDAVWWAIVTITTVGYGDQYPVTTIGRFVGVVVMIAGVGIIASLASILTSIISPGPKAAPSERAGPAKHANNNEPQVCLSDDGSVQDCLSRCDVCEVDVGGSESEERFNVRAPWARCSPNLELVPRRGLEPRTARFSVVSSTN